MSQVLVSPRCVSQIDSLLAPGRSWQALAQTRSCILPASFRLSWRASRPWRFLAASPRPREEGGGGGRRRYFCRSAGPPPSRAPHWPVSAVSMGCLCSRLSRLEGRGGYGRGSAPPPLPPHMRMQPRRIGGRGGKGGEGVIFIGLLVLFPQYFRPYNRVARAL